jgi:glycosyltransferase involved in cell wall biosynthesis
MRNSMKNNTEISVLLPTFKRETIIGRAIDSILNQSYTNFKLIIVDDNSPDNTEHVVKKYNDERIKYIKNSLNIGHPINFAKCMDLVESDFFMIFGDDDEMMPNSLELLITFLLKYPNIPLAHGIETFTKEDGTEIKDTPLFHKTKPVDSSIYLDATLSRKSGFGISFSSALFRTEFIKFNNIPVIHDHYWDFNFYCHCYLYSEKIGYINEYTAKRFEVEMFHEREIAPFLYSSVERLYLAQKFINNNEFYLLARKYPISKYRYSLSKNILKQSLKVKRFDEALLCINTALKNALKILIPIAVYYLLIPLKWVLRLRRVIQG